MWEKPGPCPSRGIQRRPEVNYDTTPGFPPRFEAQKSGTVPAVRSLMSEQRAVRNLAQRPLDQGAFAGRQVSALRWVVAGLTVVAAAVLVPFWAPLLFAAWAAIIAARSSSG